MSLSSITGQAYERGLPAIKWVRLIDAVIRRETLQDVGEAIAECLLRLLWPLRYPSTILISYVRAALQEYLVTPTTLSCLIIRSAAHQTSPGILRSLCGVLLEQPLPLFPDTFPPYLNPVDLGSTASTSSPPSAQPTLALITPLIQTSLQMVDVKVTTVLTYMVANLPMEAPPLQVALGAAELLPALQAQGAEPLHRTLIGVLQSAGDTSGIIAAVPAAEKPEPMVVDSQQSDSTALEEAGPSLLLAGPMLLLVEQAIAVHPASNFVSGDISPVNPKHLDIIKIGSHLTSDAHALLHHVVEATVRLVLGSGKKRNDSAFCFAINGLSDLVQFWRDGRIEGRNIASYPDGSLPGTLSAVFKDDTLVSQAAAFDSRAREHFSHLMSETEGDDDGGFLDEQRIKPLFVLIADSFVTRGLMTTNEMDDLGLLGASADDMDFSAIEESFAARLSRAHKNQIPALIHRLLYTPSLHGPFAQDVLTHLHQARSVPPSDNLLPILTSALVLLHIIAQHVSPALLTQTLISEIILAGDDPSSRAEDPQGCLTRYGEAVVLTEVIESVFGLKEAFALMEARRVKALPDLSAEERTCLNGWVKALFGPDGIEDEVLFATHPAAFLRLCSTLVQQSIDATKAEVIDIDTLRGGLSYFAQPLLSWCTGRVVTWLCEEIPRQGLLSAIHLDVLQTLVLSSGFPDPVLKLTAPLIARVIRPGTGLEPVIQSARIDTAALYSRLASAGTTDDASDATSGTLGKLRDALQLLLHPEMLTSSVTSFAPLEAYAARWSPVTAAQTLLVEFAAASAPAQLVQRLAIVALQTMQSGSLLAAAVRMTVPDLLHRDIYSPESAGRIAGFVAKAVAANEHFAGLGEELVKMLLAYGRQLRGTEGKRKTDVKSATGWQRTRFWIVASAISEIPDLTSVDEDAHLLRDLLQELG